MLKLMIVDDESIVRNDFKHMISSSNSAYKIVAEASNGREALEKFRKYRPDVVITDIKMPLMDGIELAGCILNANKKTKIILLSSYGEFHLAQKAIDLGIYSYLLKHEIDSNSMLDHLSKLSEQIRKEAKAGRSKSIVELLQNKMDTEAESALLERYDLTWLKKSLLLIVFHMEKDSEHSSGAASLTERDLLDIFQDTTTQSMQWEGAQLSESEVVCFFKIEGTASEYQQIIEATALAGRIQVNLKREHHIIAVAAVGGPSIPGESLSKLYDQTKAKLAYKVFYRGQAVITAFPPIYSDSSGFSVQKAELDKLKHHFYQGEYEQAHVFLKKILIEDAVERKDLAMLDKAVDGLLLFVRDYVTERNPEHADHYDPYKLQEEVRLLGNVYLIFEWFSLLLERLRQEYSRRYSLKILKAISYIHGHFNKEIGLEELSRVMDVSPIYASQLFKKEVGESFTTYLTKYRIKAAAELLRTGSYKIYEIGDMVGYRSTAYFCRIFKQYTGKNPSDYEHGGGGRE